MPVYFKICWYFLDRSYIIKTSKKKGGHFMFRFFNEDIDDLIFGEDNQIHVSNR